LLKKKEQHFNYWKLPARFLDLPAMWNILKNASQLKVIVIRVKK